MMEKQITHVDYDSLLKIFIGNDDLRPALQQANTIGDKTYATDAHAIVIIPNNLLKRTYEPHPKVPNYDAVIGQAKDREPLYFKDVDLFRIMEKQPKVHGSIECEQCEGRGSCPHCGAFCEECDGNGEVEDKSQPMEYNHDQTYIQIAGKKFSPLQIGKLEKTIIETHAETFMLIKENNTCAYFKVGEIEILIARMASEDHEERPTFILKPINHEKETST